MIDELAEYLESGGQCIDAETIQELMTFGIDETTGKLGAQEGHYDDRVISFGIALVINKRRGDLKNFSKLVVSGILSVSVYPLTQEA